MKIYLIKRNGILKPFYKSDIDYVENKIKENVAYSYDIKKARNYKHHKKYWALCRLMADQGNFNTEEDASDYLKFMSKNVDYIIVEDNISYVKPKHINYETMGQDQFSAFWDTIIPHVVKKLGCDMGDIENNLIFYL